MPVRRECKPPGRYGAQQHSPKSSEMRQARHSGAKVPHRPRQGGIVRVGTCCACSQRGHTRWQGGVRVPGGPRCKEGNKDPKQSGSGGEDQLLKREAEGWMVRSKAVEIAEGPIQSPTKG